MAAVLKVLAVAFVVAVALAGARVTAETHHVVGGGPDFNVTAWLLGRLFTVGDKLWFEISEGDEKIVEVGSAEEFVTCNVTNPIRLLTEPVSLVALEEEGVRYFTSGDLNTCLKGLKLPVTVHPDLPPPPYHPDLPSPPYHPDVPSPPHRPPPSPSAAAGLSGRLCLMLAAAVWVYCVVI